MSTKKGKVILVGAGPGDPELITVKAVRWLQKAEIVLADRLVSPQIIEDYVSHYAEVIPVGKQCGRGVSTPQSYINELLVKYAQQGKLVVRLKGGDVSIFSNILDELTVLAENHIPYEIIPGITAATGIAAFAAIPLTARNHSKGVRFLTYYKSDILPEEYWKELAQTDDTLVFYMSSETASEVVEKLTAHHISPDKLLAVVEQGTTPNQQITVLNLYEYSRATINRKLASPSLLIIGKVVQLHQQFKWLENGLNTEEYFEPVVLQPLEQYSGKQKLATA
ncbi:MAG TPA: uroporphyrinogen-III C-methyltransferase [Flavisolibacter sp.]|nr:uroporphyrinogen-III C-methyltransferase [Flavisolibacter sp.]